MGNEVWVTDYQTSKIHVYAKDGTATAIYETGLAANSITGIAQSPSGQVFFTDIKASKVYRLDP